jgi:hypothetical protein
MRQALAVLMLLFAAGSRADTLLTIKARLETTPPQPVTEKSLGEAEWQLWVGDHRLREDTPKLSSSVIRLFDRKKLYFIDHRAKTYAEVDLPFNPATLGASHQTGKPAAAGDIPKESGRRQKEQMTVTVTDEVRRIGPWNARKVVVVSRGSLGETTAVKWVSAEVGVDEGTLNRWQADAVVLPPGSFDPEMQESQRQLNAIPGYTVLQESRSSRGPGETEFRWHTELVSAEKKEPPAGLYEPPDGYMKVAFDQMSLMPTEKPEYR